MVHPQVLENCGYDPERYTGFAFGSGDRPRRVAQVSDPRHPDAGGRRHPFPRAVRGEPVRVPLSWLREFVPIELDVETLAERIDAHGIKVEGIERPWAGLEGVVVARVLEVRDHPNSDKLCSRPWTAGKGRSRSWSASGTWPPAISSRGPSPAAGYRRSMSRSARNALRGEMSNGMLCSPRELAISHEHETGILILPDELPSGADLKSALGLDDAVLDIEVEPNRPDFLSVYGVARETSSILGLPLSEPDATLEEDPERADEVATVELARTGRLSLLPRAGAPRRVGRITPLRAQARLTAAGMRPVAPIVDATNYAMLELGQPLHAFDMQRLAGPGHRRAPSRGRRASRHPRRRGAGAHRGGPADLRSREAGRDRRHHGRADVRGLRHDDRRPARERLFHAGPGSSGPRAASSCTPRRPTASSAVPTRRVWSGPPAGARH